MLLKLIILTYFALRTLHKGAVLILVGIKIAGQATTGVIVVLVESTQAMVLVEHIVKLNLRRETFPYLFGFLLGIAGNRIFTLAIWYQIVHIILLQTLAMTIATCPERCCYIQSASTIVHIQIIGKRVTILVHAARIIPETDTLALRLLQRNANHSLG